MREQKEKPSPVKWVNITSFDPIKRASKALVVVVLENNQISFEDKGGGENVINNLTEQGVMSPEGEKLYPKDGELFLNVLHLDMIGLALGSVGLGLLGG